MKKIILLPILLFTLLISSCTEKNDDDSKNIAALQTQLVQLTEMIELLNDQIISLQGENNTQTLLLSTMSNALSNVISQLNDLEDGQETQAENLNNLLDLINDVMDMIDDVEYEIDDVDYQLEYILYAINSSSNAVYLEEQI